MINAFAIDVGLYFFFFFFLFSGTRRTPGGLFCFRMTCASSLAVYKRTAKANGMGQNSAQKIFHECQRTFGRTKSNTSTLNHTESTQSAADYF